MKKSILVVFVLLLVLGGCKGKDKTKVYYTKEGKVEVSEKEEGKVKEMTVTTEKGTATLKTAKGEIPEDLGVPVYPGASAKEGGTLSLSGDRDGKKGSYSSTFLTTGDDIEKVIDYYKNELGEKAEFYEMTTPNGKMASFTLGGDQPEKITVMLTQNPDKKVTNIHITKMVEEK